ncbi:C-_U-editing enzyme APOBEC-2 [Bombina bombina]|uniref:C->U-editing enzyme APOBEC-2 n=1 Tax=Bombina bombina TaxID=8345 RepID=UPI00235A4936|nr:C->U-editing enzyme APOBEC-2 [Bombina bombina]
MSQKKNKSQPPQVALDPPEGAAPAPAPANGDGEGDAEAKKKEMEELPPFEIVEGSRIPASSFKFQFKNVEYSSGRNKTLLCYTIDRENQIYRGYLEDEHVSAHAEEAFFTKVLPQFLASGKINVTCYVSSSPCVSCAAAIAQCLKRSKAPKLRFIMARLFQWEESEIRGALRALRTAGAQLSMMNGADYAQVWQNFVEPDVTFNEEGNMEEQGTEQGIFIPWEDLEENARYYEEKLNEILR